MKKIIYTTALLATSFFAKAQTASVMAIHNCADPAADTVDLYLLDGMSSTRISNNLGFRQATGFINAPASRPIRIIVAGKNSTSIADSLIGFGYNLPANGKFILIAQGHLGNNFIPKKPFTLNVAANVENSNTANVNKIAVYHGSTDAPTVDIKAFSKNDFSNKVNLALGASYGDITSYTSVPNADYLINVSLPNMSDALFTYSAPLKTLNASGEPIFAFASGFLSPSTNSNGKSFGLFAVLKNGTVIALPLITTSKLQIIHNSPDALASSVDIYSDVTGSITKLLDNVAYRTATPYLTVPANIDFKVWIAPANSTSFNDAVFNVELNLPGGVDAVAVALGVLDTSKYENGKNVAFNLALFPGSSKSSGNTTDIVVLHGSTDAPVIDVRLGSTTGTKIVDGAKFFDNTSILNVPSNDVSLVILSTGGSTAVAAYNAPLSAFKDSGLVVMASGFLTPNLPAGKDAGAAFGLFAVTASGRVIALPTSTLSSKLINSSVYNLYPNPAQNNLTINTAFNIISIEIYDINGKKILSNNKLNTINIETLNNGIYTVKAITNNGLIIDKFTKN